MRQGALRTSSPANWDDFRRVKARRNKCAVVGIGLIALGLLMGLLFFGAQCQRERRALSPWVSTNTQIQLPHVPVPPVVALILVATAIALGFGLMVVSSSDVASLRCPNCGDWFFNKIGPRDTFELRCQHCNVRIGEPLPQPIRRQIDADQCRDGKCGTCGYDLHGNVSGRCPECGLRT